MKRQVRKNVFETNSSSSHSLTLNTEDFSVDTSMVPVDGVVTIHKPDGEFGWEWFKDNDAYTKALYAIIDGCEDLVRQAIHKQLGAYLDITIGTSGVDCFPEGHIDHNSYGNVKDNVSTIDDMISFIFNKNSWLFGGNDNGSAPLGFYDTPYYDSDGQMQDNDYLFSMELFNTKLEIPVSRNININVLENIINHGTSTGYYIDEQNGRSYDSYSFSIDMDKKEVLFKTYCDGRTDPHLKDSSWEEKREYAKQFDKIIKYEISKR